MTSRDSDEQLMQQVQQGQRDCASVLVRRYATPLLTFVQRMVQDHHLSEELVQDVFLAVWHKRKQYRYPRSFRAWLYTIAHNRCRLHFRRKRPVSNLDDAPQAEASADDPSGMAADSELAHLVTEVVSELPEQQRTVVALRVWNGLAYSEIADIIKRSEATARSHMHHALITMRQRMAKLVESDPA